MGDIKRDKTPNKYVEVHTHYCPNCKRPFTCACEAQPDKQSLVCIDCEHGTYNPVIHGGFGERSEA